MKQLFLLLLVLYTSNLQAKNYYISAKGLDTNDGLTTASAWQTITKLNAAFGSIAAGDSILFKCGETFYGSIVLGKSGTSTLPIIFSSYGTGAKPVITGFTTASSWTNMGGGIWKTTLSAASSQLKVVTINGNLQRMGRWPNYDVTTGGWLFYDAIGGTASSPTISDNQLLGLTSTNWTGANVVIKKYSYITDICPITAQSGNTITYSQPYDFAGLQQSSTGTLGYGYFIQNDIRTLDQFGEWYLNTTTKDLSVYFGTNDPASYNIKVSTIDKVITLGDGGFGTSGTTAYNNIVIKNIAVEGGNYAGVFTFNGSNITVQNCSLNNNYNGIFNWHSQNMVNDNNSITNSLNDGIGAFQQPTTLTITNNYVKNAGLFEGMAGSGSFASHGIETHALSNTTIKYNTIDSIGYVGIEFGGSNALIQYNYVTNYCAVKDDGGGIYTFQEKDKTNRVIDHNIVINGIGDRRGRINDANAMTWSIYTDGGSTNFEITNNTVSQADGGGYQMNSGVNINYRNNTTFNVPRGFIINRFPNDPLVRNIRISGNQVYPTKGNFEIWNSSLSQPATVDDMTDMRAIGTFDSNYYRNDVQIPFNHFYNTSFYGTGVYPDPMNLSAWKSFLNGETHSAAFPEPLSYTINSTISGGVTSNGAFTSNISGYNNYTPNGNQSISWDGTSKITGTGSLKITHPSVIQTNWDLINGPLASVVAGHYYILKFKSLGTTLGSEITANLRLTNSPYTAITPVQYDYTTNSITQHEFLFTPTQSAAASVELDFRQSSGITYIDDVEFYEVNVTILDPSTQVRLEYNATNTDKTISLGATYVTADGTVYNGSITLHPYSSAVLFISGTTSAALRADAGTDISLVLPVNNTVLKGSATGAVTGYSWRKISGPGQFTIASPTTPSTAISNLAVGVYIFQLKVVNSAGDSALSTVSVTQSGVLPVKLIDFTAKNNNDKISLQWQVASEINVSHYAIERSSNGQDFENIGELNANNLVDIQMNYNFADNFPMKGTNYYRLVMIDIDGSIEYSKTVSASVSNVASFTLFNVALSASNSNIKTILNSNSQQKMHLVLADVSGRIIFASEVQLQKGFNAIDNKIPAINTGIYYAKLFTEDLAVTKTLLGTK